MRLIPVHILTPWLLSAGLLCSLTAHAAPDAPPVSASALSSYTTRASDTLEKVVLRHYPNSPLQTQWLVRLLQELNADTLGKTSGRQRLKAGLVLHMPSHEQLVKQVLITYLPADSLQAPVDNSPQARRSWVHYP